MALTLTPALCALLLKPHNADHKPARFFVWFNWWFASVTHRYVRIVRMVKDAGLRSMLVFALMILAMGWLFKVVPTGLVPDEDQGYILGLGILADGAARPRTEAVMEDVTKQMMAQPAVENILTISGLDLTSMGVKSNYGTFFVMLKDWKVRKTPDMASTVLTQRAFAMGANLPEALVIAFNPPPISGMSRPKITWLCSFN